MSQGIVMEDSLSGEEDPQEEDFGVRGKRRDKVRRSAVVGERFRVVPACAWRLDRVRVHQSRVARSSTTGRRTRTPPPRGNRALLALYGVFFSGKRIATNPSSINTIRLLSASLHSISPPASWRQGKVGSLSTERSAAYRPRVGLTWQPCGNWRGSPPPPQGRSSPS